MALPWGNFALEQVLPLRQNPWPVISESKAAGLLGFGDQPLTIVVEPFEFAHRIIEIDEGTTKA